MPLLSLVLTLLAAEPSWKAEGTHDGVTLESRPVEGSPYFEYRARADTGAEANVLCDAVFEWGSVGTDHAHLKARRLLEDSGDTRVVHDQLDAPMVSRREVTFAITRQHRSDGTCSIEYRVRNDKAPQSTPGAVRLEVLRGTWLFEPTGGKTRVTYTLFAEPGGKVAPLFVHGTQRQATIDTVRNGIAKAPRAAGR